MKKLAEKVALVAELCIAVVFILTTILYLTNAIPQQTDWQSNGVLVVLMIVLAVIFVAIAAYLLYVNFSCRENLKQILLFCDSKSATHTNTKVLGNIVSGCAKQVDGVTVHKIRVCADEKGGFIATLNVKVTVDNVAESINKLRCLLTESFKNTLGLSFNTINFNIERIRGRYEPKEKRAEVAAETLTQNQEATSANYEQPLQKHETTSSDHEKPLQNRSYFDNTEETAFTQSESAAEEKEKENF